MLIEALKYLFSQASPEARKLGLLKDSIALESRARRVRKSWQPHLEKCHRLISDFVADKMHTPIWILGSGPLFDIPIDSLLPVAKHIHLVDIVHPQSVRFRFRKNTKVTLHEVDLSGTAQGVLRWSPNSPLPSFAPPNLKVDGPLISANILSQLPLSQRLWLDRRHRLGFQELEDWSNRLMQDHLRWLEALGVPTLVISDWRCRLISPRGDLLSERVTSLSVRGEKIAEWTWNLAPLGEASRDYSIELDVRATRR